MSNQRTKILFVVSTLSLGGIEREVTDLTTALKSSGNWEPSVCCLLTKEGPFLSVLENRGIPVYECKLDRTSLISFPFRYARLLKQISPSIVHSHIDFSIPWQVLGCLLASVRGIVFTQQNDYPYWNHSSSARWRMRFYYWVSKRFIKRYTTVSTQVRVNFSRMLKCSENQFEVVHNSVDTTIFKSAPDVRDEARSALGIDGQKYIVGTIARFSEQKGHIYLIDAAKELLRDDSSFHFVLIGEGPLRTEIENRVREYHLTEYFTFAGGRIDVNNLYPALDCVALPSLWEGFGITLIEAMASGVPVVATSVGGIPEIMDYGGCGVLVRPRDPGSLRDGILEVKRNPEKTRILIKNARERVVERFSLVTSLKSYENIYRRILDL